MSRKLDALVAERVIELNECPDCQGHGILAKPLIYPEPPDTPCQRCNTRGKIILDPRKIPLYSTSWAGMGEVVEKMEGEGFVHKHEKFTRSLREMFQKMDMEKPDCDYSGVRFDFILYEYESDSDSFIGYADQLSAACSIAALRAKGVPEEEIQEALK